MIQLVQIILLLINITMGGATIVQMNVHAPNYTLINLTLPVQPIKTTLNIVDSCNNVLPYTYTSNNTILIVTGNCSDIRISYVAFPYINSTVFRLVINTTGNYKNI